MIFQKYIFEKEKTLEFHKELNDNIWDKIDNKNILNKKVREKLIEIAGAWVEYANIPKDNIRNILFTGSLANYNYTQFSDVDLHILIDYEKINKDFDFLYDYFKDKKLLWSDNHDIKIKGYPVELYAQPLTERPHTNQGVYSITSNKWIQEPKPIEIDLENDDVFDKKLSDYMEQIDDIVEGKGTIKNIEKFKEKIRKMRGASIAKSGEFSQENLIFKSLRNSGYLEKLTKYHHGLVDKKLSLEKVINNETLSKAKILKERAKSLLDESYEPGQEVQETEADVYERYLEYVSDFKKRFKDVEIETTRGWVRKKEKGDSIESSLSITNNIIFTNNGRSEDYYNIRLKNLIYNSVDKKFIDYCKKIGFVYWWYGYENRIFIRNWKARGDSDIREIVTEKV